MTLGVPPPQMSGLLSCHCLQDTGRHSLQVRPRWRCCLQKETRPSDYLLAMEKAGVLRNEWPGSRRLPQWCSCRQGSWNARVATKQLLHRARRLSDAEVIVTALGDPDGEKGRLVKGDIPDYDGVLHVHQLTRIVSYKALEDLEVLKTKKNKRFLMSD